MKALLITTLLIASTSVFADSHMKPTAEERAIMAAMHEQMATCLKTDKEMHDCMSESHKICEDKMGADKCQKMRKGHMKMMMHGMHGKMMGHKHEKMKKESTQETTTTQSK